jgi:hypothetical protein
VQQQVEHHPLGHLEHQQVELLGRSQLGQLEYQQVELEHSQLVQKVPELGQ